MDPSSDHMNPFLHNPLPSSPSSQPLDSLFHERSMENFGGIGRSAEEGAEEEEEEMGSMYRQQAGKKRRLAAGQVEYLEKSFEVENKLEPERKNRLAKELGLQPRQVAIWFQNRRARFKTKQLERDYDALKASFDSLKADYDGLVKENQMLQNEVSLLTTKLKLSETRDPNSPIRKERPEPAPVKAMEEVLVTLLPCKQEEASSAKSDVSDSESPQCPEMEHSTSRGFEHERSDFSQEEAEDLTGTFLPVADYGFGKAEEGDFHGGSCSGLGLPGLDGQPSYWPWLY